MIYFNVIMNNRAFAELVCERLAKADLPEKSGLQYTDSYTLLVSAILSARSKDDRVNMITPALFSVASNPKDMLKLGYDALIEYINTIGLYRNKAKNIIKLSEIIVNEFDSKVPDTLEKLIELPGVGRKTANVILNVIYNQAAFPVDTHVFRVSRRIGLSNGSTVDAVEKDLIKNIPAKYAQQSHHWIVWHGRRTCTARNPKCESCTLKDICEYYKQNSN